MQTSLRTFLRTETGGEVSLDLREWVNSGLM
jgi:hypothetical protein